MIDFDHYSAYDDDVQLLSKLNLPAYEMIPNHTKHYIGQYRKNHNSVKMWVEGCPAQFFWFEIRIGKKVIKIQTGSGSLTKYWGMVEDIIDNMVVIEVAEGATK